MVHCREINAGGSQLEYSHISRRAKSLGLARLFHAKAVFAFRAQKFISLLVAGLQCTGKQSVSSQQ
jgi:hypothetical protein